MTNDFDLIGALTSFSVGTLDGRDAMMVIEIAATPDDFARGIRHQMPVAMTADRARELGEALLMAAEAEVELGNLETARGYVNQIRTRAANSFVMDGGAPAANYVIGTYDAAWTDQALARDAVRFERKLELSGEGHRFYDLVRWGIAEPTLNAYLTYERSKVSATPFSGAVFNAGKDELLPIPQREIDIIGADILHQNPGY